MHERDTEKKGYIKVYTRADDAADGIYPNGLARSIHFAYSYDDVCYEPLNKNYGILFAKGLISDKNTIVPKGVRAPQILKYEDGRYCIFAVRTEENGELEKEEHIEAWYTADFCAFEPIEQPDIPNALREQAFEYVEVTQKQCEKIVRYWCGVYHTEIQIPKKIMISSREELEKVKAVALYSDGSSDVKEVDWNLSDVELKKGETVMIHGTVRENLNDFPLIKGYGDPVLFKWEEKWYYISTNDNTDDIGIYVRESDSVQGLFEKDTKQHLILDVDEEHDFVQTFWAPEFHVIGGELYILLAIGGKVWSPQCYMMKLKKGGRIVDSKSWETPIRVQKKDGSWLAETGISLDMTFIDGKKNGYLVWSYRENIGNVLDTGSMLYIAEVDKSKPWKLASDPVLLSRPLYGWENTEGTINNEGPYAFIKEGKIYLTYSGGAANGYSYAVGLLTAEDGADLLKMCNWKKNPTAVLSFYSTAGIYGPGHNSFFVEDDGKLMIAYHGVENIDSNLRCIGIRRVHFDVDGNPVWGMSSEEELSTKLCHVTMQVQII